MIGDAMDIVLFAIAIVVFAIALVMAAQREQLKMYKDYSDRAYHARFVGKGYGLFIVLFGCFSAAIAFFVDNEVLYVTLLCSTLVLFGIFITLAVFWMREWRETLTECQMQYTKGLPYRRQVDALSKVTPD